VKIQGVIAGWEDLLAIVDEEVQSHVYFGA
jgi:hypothetical protein